MLNTFPIVLACQAAGREHPRLVVTDSLYVQKDLTVKGTVRAKGVGLDDVCVDREQLKALLELMQSSSAPLPQAAQLEAAVTRDTGLNTVTPADKLDDVIEE